jgi:hypothetical protein
MNIIDVQYDNTNQVLGFKFDNGGMLFWGAGFLPGTDVPTYRFISSLGITDKEDYKVAQGIARRHSKSLGFNTIQDHFESLRTSQATDLLNPQYKAGVYAIRLASQVRVTSCK